MNSFLQQILLDPADGREVCDFCKRILVHFNHIGQTSSLTERGEVICLPYRDEQEHERFQNEK